MHISLDSALGQQRRLNQVGETISSIAAPDAAYSFRSLTGGDPRVVGVRRSSDNADRNFTASELSSGALVDFVGSGNDGFVHTWYDQSGNNHHAKQGADAEQPKIVIGGSFFLKTSGVTFNGSQANPCSLSVTNDAGADVPVITASSSGTYSAFSVQTVSLTEAGYLYGNASTTPLAGTSLYANANKYALSNKNLVNLDQIPRSSASQNLLSAVYASNDAGLLVNGTGTMTSSGTYDFSAGSDSFIMGNRNDGNADATFLTGSIHEIIIYNSNQSSNRTALETNIMNYYSLP